MWRGVRERSLVDGRGAPLALNHEVPRPGRRPHPGETTDGALLSAASFALPWPPAALAALAARVGKTVIVGVRPENIVEAGRPAREPTAALELVAELVEPLGNEIVLHGRRGDDLLVFKMDPHRQPAMGAVVNALVELDAMHLFDGESELRIAC